MSDQINSSGKSPDNTPTNTSDGKSRWFWYVVILVLAPVLISLICFYLRDGGWTGVNLTMVALFFAGYWFGVIAVAAKLLRNREALRPVRLASPLIELHLSQEMREQLVCFAIAQQQKPAVAAFDILDQEIPRFEPEGERDRARLDNEHLRQQAGQGAFLVAVTNEILKRLLLISGAYEEDRRVWRTHISETAARIVRDSLDHHLSLAD